MACKCKKNGEEATEECKYYIDFPEDDDCCLISIEKHGDMGLEQVAERLGVTFQRIQQAEAQAIKKLALRFKIAGIDLEDE